MRLPTIALVLLFVLSGCAQPGRTRYQPQMLAAEARQAVALGKLHDARILLERAALLAPHDGAIALELARVRAVLAGASEPAAPPEPAGVTPKAAPPAAPLPAPWPLPPPAR